MPSIDLNQKYLILYKQPTLGPPRHSGKKRDIIWMEMEEEVDASDDNDARQQALLFMEQGQLVVETITYQRALKNLVKFFPYRVVSSFLPSNNHPSKQLSA